MHTAPARKLRSTMTDAERKLWRALRHRFVEGHRFRRQGPIGAYIVDFCCLQLGLVIEADGSQHADSESDEVRDAWLAEQGYRVLRFWNADIQTNFESVMETIMHAVLEREAQLDGGSRSS